MRMRLRYICAAAALLGYGVAFAFYTVRAPQPLCPLCPYLDGGTPAEALRYVLLFIAPLNAALYAIGAGGIAWLLKKAKALGFKA